MSRFAMIAALVLGLAAPGLVIAQSTEDHGEVGVFADYFRFTPGSSATNFVGVGGRLGVNVHPNIMLEGEMNYDFKRNYTNTFSNGVTTSFVTTGVRPLTGLFGPRIYTGTSGPRYSSLAKWASSTSMKPPVECFRGRLSRTLSMAWAARAPMLPFIQAEVLNDSLGGLDCAWKLATRFTSITARLTTCG